MNHKYLTKYINEQGTTVYRYDTPKPKDPAASNRTGGIRKPRTVGELKNKKVKQSSHASKNGVWYVKGGKLVSYGNYYILYMKDGREYLVMNGEFYQVR